MLGFLSTIGYGYMASLAGENLNATFPVDVSITHFLWTSGFLFVLYGILVLKLFNGYKLSTFSFCLSAVFACVFRLLLLPTELILENDIYRYLWDGHVWHQGVNPFQYAPADPATLPYRTEYWSKINFPDVPTIYPPTLQYIFYLTQWLIPASVVGMKIVFVLFDLGTVLLLIRLLQTLSLPKEWVLIYAWSPLVIKEIANSGHADSISAFFLTATLLMTTNKKIVFSAVVMALFVLTKYFGVLLLPLFWRPWKWRGYAVFAGTILLMYAPFLSWDINLFEGFLTFSREWRFNSGLFMLIEDTLIDLHLVGYFNADAITRNVMFSVILCVVAWQSWKTFFHYSNQQMIRSIFIIMGTLLLCSPVINVWYLVWFIPLLCIQPNRAWILFTALIFLSYTYYYEFLFYDWVKWVEFGIFFLLLIDDWLWSKISNQYYAASNCEGESNAEMSS